MPSHRLIHPELAKSLAGAIAPQWPSYTGVSTLMGTTADGRCTVYYDASLGPLCGQNAMDLLTDAPKVMQFNDSTFGGVGGHVDVIVFALGGATDGTGGADHMGCDFTSGAQIEVCASFGQSARVSALFEAELSECSMNGQLCGSSTGEALSRWCAMEVSGNALADFATAPQWAADGMPNFVDTVDPTDQNADSTGCGMAFISWLMASTVGRAQPLTLSFIARLMVQNGDAGTLAMLYPVPANAWTDFQSAIVALPAGITTDDPFGAMGTPVPGPTPPPVPTPTPTPTPGVPVSAVMWASLAADALIAGVATGETADELKADIDAIPTT